MIVDPSGMFIFARWPDLSLEGARIAIDDLALVKGASLRLGFCYFVILGPGAYKVHYSRLVIAHMNDFHLTSRSPPRNRVGIGLLSDSLESIPGHLTVKIYRLCERN